MPRIHDLCRWAVFSVELGTPLGFTHSRSDTFHGKSDCVIIFIAVITKM